MFGLKLISVKAYDKMVQLVERHTNSHNATEAQIDQLRSDCDSLRQQLNDKIKEIKKLKAKDDKQLSRINKLLSKLKDKSDVEFDVITEPTMCDLCKHEFKSCKKIIVGDTTVCVVPKIPFPCE